MKNKHQLGFTMIEIMIVITIIIILAIVILVTINPSGQITKIQDVQRKRDLNQMSKILEEFYTDKEAYPVANDICIDNPINQNGVCSCHVCGLSNSNSKIASYSNKLYCDPTYPNKQYLYQYDCSNTPTWYKLCTSLDRPDSQVNSSRYNYGISSTNVDIESCYAYDLDGSPAPLETPAPSDIPIPTNIPTQIPSSTPSLIPTNIIQSPTPYLSPTPWPTNLPMPTCHPDPVGKWCIKSGCNNCGTFEQCQSVVLDRCDQPVLHLFNASCQQECRF